MHPLIPWSTRSRTRSLGSLDVLVHRRSGRDPIAARMPLTEALVSRYLEDPGRAKVDCFSSMTAVTRCSDLNWPRIETFLNRRA